MRAPLGRFVLVELHEDLARHGTTVAMGRSARTARSIRTPGASACGFHRIVCYLSVDCSMPWRYPRDG